MPSRVRALVTPIGLAASRLRIPIALAGVALVVLVVATPSFGARHHEAVGGALWPPRPPAPTATPLPAGIPERVAIQLAEAHVMPDAVFLSAVAGRYGDVAMDDDRAVAPGAAVQPEALVWAAKYGAQFTICPPDGLACYTPRPGYQTVILDYRTGAFLESLGFSPAVFPTP
jgi:hypothetical protein